MMRFLVSTFLMHRGAFYAVTGRRPTDELDQAIWAHFRDRSSIVWHPDERFRLPERFLDVFVSAKFGESFCVGRCR